MREHLHSSKYFFKRLQDTGRKGIKTPNSSSNPGFYLLGKFRSKESKGTEVLIYSISITGTGQGECGSGGDQNQEQMGWILKVIHHLPPQKIIPDVQTLSWRKAIRKADGFPPWRWMFFHTATVIVKILLFDRFNNLRAAQISTLWFPAGLTDKTWVISAFSTWGYIISAGAPHLLPFSQGTKWTNVSHPWRTAWELVLLSHQAFAMMQTFFF